LGIFKKTKTGDYINKIKELHKKKLIISYLSTLASLTLIILFSEMLKFSEIISSKSKKYCERK